MTSPENQLVIGTVLFALGAVGFLTRRNLILMMLSSELMLHGVALNLVTFSNVHGDHQGQAFTAFVLTVAASDAGIALALILTLFRRRKSLDVDLWSDLGEQGPQPKLSTQPAPVVAPSNGSREWPLPQLSPAGRAPIDKVAALQEAPHA